MNDEAAATAAPETPEETAARGFVGVADERDRDEYALTTGPDSPSAAQATLEAKLADIQAQLDEIKANVKARAEAAKGKVSAAAEGAKARVQTRRGEQ
jgi:hypothetical protein